MTFKVSCLVSVYNGIDFVYGCLNDLVNQSLYKQGKAEIIIVDSASSDNIWGIVERFKKDFPNIQYVRTDDRETLYAAWNRAVELSKGQYLTNANTDDRHKDDFLQVLSDNLDKFLDVDLVYSDVYQSEVANQTFNESSNSVTLKYPQFSFSDVLFHFQFGCQPMWRRSLHDKIGMFDPSMKAAGDWDFNFRFNLAGRVARHVGGVYGLFYKNPNSVSVVNNASTVEQSQLRTKYITYENIIRLLELDKVDVKTNDSKSEALCELALKALRMRLPWEHDQIFSDVGLAKAFFETALQLNPNNLKASEGINQCQKLI
jgi:hypothetical protein